MLFSFFRRNETDLQVPNWASYFTPSEYSKFIKLLSTYLNKQNISYTYGNGTIQTKEGHFGAETLGLINLAQLCKQTRQNRWKDIISGHFAGLKKAAIFQSEFDANVHDYTFASQYLAVRLYHNDYVSHLEDGLVIGRQLTDDIFALLVFDFPYSVMNVKPEQTIQWNKYNEELFEMGLSNVRSKYNFNISPKKVGNTTIQTIYGDHFFVANIVLDIKNHGNLIGSKGSLVGIPHRQCVLVYPIENLEVISTINQLIPMIARLEDEGPGSISPNIFWFNGDEFLTLPYTFEEQIIQFFPPEKFAGLLNELKAK